MDFSKLYKWQIRNSVIAVFGALFLSFFSQAFAGEADVKNVKVYKENDGTYRFEVTVLHDDSGWDHYANMWEVVSLEGEVLAVRVLAHPHETEQPFTRSLSGIEIPKGTKRVMVRANDSVHELGGIEFDVVLQK